MTTPAPTDPAGMSDLELVQAYAPLVVDRDTADFYRGWLARELRVARCHACGHTFLPPRPVCPVCWSEDVGAVAVSGRGTIFLCLLLHQGPPAPGVDYAAGPYPVVTVELEERAGLRFTSTVVGTPAADLAVGQAVTLDWIDRNGVPFPAFRVVEGAA
jgi:uncharacterized OB-fold protein